MKKAQDEGSDPQALRLLPLTESTYFILLALLTPRHGYGIMQYAAAISGDRIKIGPGTLYGALNTLLKLKLIERVGERGAEDERRKVYGLTGTGRRAVILETERLGRLASIGRRVLDGKED